jgi:predicted acyl esterase
LKDLDLPSEDEVELTNPTMYLGPSGLLRASRRALDSKLSTENWAVHSHTQETERKVNKGEVVKLEIGIWPAGMAFAAGEKLMLKVAGHHMTLAEHKPIRGKFLAGNKGRHNVHFGGQYGSRIEIPLVEL